MNPRNPRRTSGGSEPEARAKPARGPQDPPPEWRGFVLGKLFGWALSPVTGFLTSIPLAFACLFLVIGWKVGPQRLIDAARVEKLTAHAEGRIVESWMTLDWNPADMGKYHFWRPFAKAAQCAVVEFDPGWTAAPLRRAFCGPRFTYNESIALQDLRTLSPNVPFAWSRDANGFAVPEIRLSVRARDWLATHPEPDPLPNDPPTKTALESLRFDVDQPIDLAAAGWTTPAVTTFPLVFDKRDPMGALPAGFVTQVLDQPPKWLSLGFFVLFLVPGVLVWIEGMAFLLGAMPRWAFWPVALVPLLALPWWGERMPRFIGHLNSQAAELVTLVLGDVDRLGGMDASAPESALLAKGERLAWHLDDSLYADTLGRLRFAQPNPPPKSKDEALHVLIASVTAQVHALDAAERAALFARLLKEKEGKLVGAGPAFLDAAKNSVVDPEASPEERRAASRFLVAWGIEPPSSPDPRL